MTQQQVIPEAAVEAAARIIYRDSGRKRVMSYRDAKEACEADARDILEAAAPHMLSHEREETRLAHLDAVVNAGTLSKHEALVDELRYVADNKTADNAIGRWWGGVIRGAIDRHLGSQP